MGRATSNHVFMCRLGRPSNPGVLFELRPCGAGGNCSGHESTATKVYQWIMAYEDAWHRLDEAFN